MKQYLTSGKVTAAIIQQKPFVLDLHKNECMFKFTRYSTLFIFCENISSDYVTT